MIKDILNDAIARLNAEKLSAVNSAIVKNKSEVINPKFAELESAKNSAVASIQKEASAKIAEVSKSCAETKAQFEEEQVAAVKASVGATYDSEIASIQKELEALKDSAV